MCKKTQLAKQNLNKALHEEAEAARLRREIEDNSQVILSMDKGDTYV